jgi:methylenetetrahydrofolate dehydrogenase (NADP+)/methenyltetrahydrofolate cyclohydrolase
MFVLGINGIYVAKRIWVRKTFRDYTKGLAILLDGNKIRDVIKLELRPLVTALTERLKRPPGLAVVLVGNNPASEIYVRGKTKTSGELGIHSETITPPATLSTEELLAIVRELNSRADIDGILVQLPLPEQIDSQRVLLAVAPEKDVDGFHPCNVGNLATGRPGPKSCTPAGVIEILKRSQIPIAGQRAVIIGRSDIVGKPMALMLLHENATVTICHSKTRDLPAVCREADILIAAIGRPGMVTREFIKPGATVIDVGISRVDGKPVGDVNAADAAELSSAYTPVPGGVGPLTIAMLMMNTVAAAERKCSRPV